MAGNFRIDPDYIDVAERIREFKKAYPDGTLQPVDHDNPYVVQQVGDETLVVYRAAAYRTPEDPRPGIGTASEPYPGRTPYTKGSEIQNAETSAWGRAIVALGIPTKRIATSEDVRNREAERGQGPRQQATPTEPADPNVFPIGADSLTAMADKLTSLGAIAVADELHAILAGMGHPIPEETPLGVAKEVFRTLTNAAEQKAAADPAPAGNGHETVTATDVEKLRAAIHAKGGTPEQLLDWLRAKHGVGDGESLQSIPRNKLDWLTSLIGEIPDPAPPTRPAEPAPPAAPVAPEESQPPVHPSSARPSGCTLDKRFMECADIAEGREPKCVAGEECKHFDPLYVEFDEAIRKDKGPEEQPKERKRGSITEPQLMRVVKQTAELEELGVGREEWRQLMLEKFGVEHRDELVKTTTAPKAIDWLSRWLVDLKSGVIGPGERAVA